MDGCLFDRVGASEAVAAACLVARAFPGTLNVPVVHGDQEVMGFLLRDHGVCDALCYGCNASSSRRGGEAGY